MKTHQNTSAATPAEGKITTTEALVFGAAVKLRSPFPVRHGHEPSWSAWEFARVGGQNTFRDQDMNGRQGVSLLMEIKGVEGMRSLTNGQLARGEIEIQEATEAEVAGKRFAFSRELTEKIIEDRTGFHKRIEDTLVQ